MQSYIHQTLPALCTLIISSQMIGRITCAQNFPDSYLRLPGILNDPLYCMTLLID